VLLWHLSAVLEEYTGRKNPLLQRLQFVLCHSFYSDQLFRDHKKTWEQFSFASSLFSFGFAVGFGISVISLQLKSEGQFEPVISQVLQDCFCFEPQSNWNMILLCLWDIYDFSEEHIMKCFLVRLVSLHLSNEWGKASRSLLAVVVSSSIMRTLTLTFSFYSISWTRAAATSGSMAFDEPCQVLQHLCSGGTCPFWKW